METIREVLAAKGHDIWSVSPQTTVFDTIRLMAEKEIGAVVVLEEGRLVGILSERDYARKVILDGRSSKETKVRDIMTPRVIYARPEQRIEECMATMTQHRIRHMPVVEGDKVVGMVSLTDLAAVVIAAQGEMIQKLETYIMG